MYLSYSGYDTSKCLFKYYHQYRAKTPVVENGLSSLYGSIVGSVFEDFYNMGLWKAPDVLAALKARIPAALASAYAGVERQGRVLKWKGDAPVAERKNLYADEAELLADVEEGISNGLDTIQNLQLIGPRVGAEVRLDAVVEGHKIGGRADFLIYRESPAKQTIILDGKGSRHRELYVSATQLKWYAMLYQIRYGAPPDRIGFLFWKFRGLDALEWESFVPEDLTLLLGQVLTRIRRIEIADKAIQAGTPPVEAFPPSPCRDSCFLCAYGNPSMCPAGAPFHRT